MKRRDFLKVSAAGAAATAIASPAIAQSSPEIKWRLTSSFPKSLDTLWGGAELFCNRIAEITDGKFKITPFASGEIVPGFQVFDAVQMRCDDVGMGIVRPTVGSSLVAYAMEFSAKDRCGFCGDHGCSRGFGGHVPVPLPSNGTGDQPS